VAGQTIKQLSARCYRRGRLIDDNNVEATKGFLVLPE